MRKEETVDYHIKAAWHAISRMYNQEASKYDATMSVGYCLLNINSEEGTPATKIAPLMGLEARSLTRLLKSMEERGLIERKSDATDGRLVRIVLTEEGREKKEKAKNSVLKFNNSIRAKIPESKLQVFFEVVQEISKEIERSNKNN
jgi:DNA-binding MarR family transcriptional regulator